MTDTTPTSTAAPSTTAPSTPPVPVVSDDARKRALIGAGLRAGFGMVPLLAPGIGAKLFGFPGAQDTATARFFARLFGVRELALAAFVLTALDDREELAHVAAVNAAVDVGDVLVALNTLRRGDGIRIPAVLTTVAGTAGAATWLDLLRRLDD